MPISYQQEPPTTPIITEREAITTSAMGESSHLNSHIAQTLLGTEISSIFSNEEKLHPWHANRCQPFTQPFLRLWDCYSGSQPDSDGCMLARAPRHRLDTAESRRHSLTTHINHGIWEPTPYISFTTSPAAVEDLAELRARRGNRGSQTLTVLDPDIRLKLKLPILDVDAEMNHYEISDPYGKSNRYYVNHYACLWEVTEGEVVGHWAWDEINKTENWYRDIIIPALMDFRKVVLQDTFDLSGAIGSLSLTNKPPDMAYEEYSDTASETEDEKANSADGITKIIEGGLC